MEHEILRKPRWFSINRRDLGQIKQELQSTQASSTDNPARQPAAQEPPNNDHSGPVHRPIEGLQIRPVQSNRRGPVPVYRINLAGNWSKPVEFKFEFKSRSATGSNRFTDRLDRFTSRFGRFTVDLMIFFDG